MGEKERRDALDGVRVPVYAGADAVPLAEPEADVDLAATELETDTNLLADLDVDLDALVLEFAGLLEEMFATAKVARSHGRMLVVSFISRSWVPFVQNIHRKIGELRRIVFGESSALGLPSIG